MLDDLEDSRRAFLGGGKSCCMVRGLAGSFLFNGLPAAPPLTTWVWRSLGVTFFELLQADVSRRDAGPKLYFYLQFSRMTVYLERQECRSACIG